MRTQNKDTRRQDFDNLRRQLLALLLSWSNPVIIGLLDRDLDRSLKLQVKETISESQSNGKFASAIARFQLETIASLFRQAFKSEATEQGQWVTVSARTLSLCARAAICLDPVPTKRMQFISLGFVPLDSHHSQDHLLGEVNRLFMDSSFGISPDESEPDEAERARRLADRRFKIDGMTRRRLREQRNNPDRYPMFYIRIDRVNPEEQSSQFISERARNLSDRAIGDITNLLRSMLIQFLTQHGFQPSKRLRAKNGRQDPLQNGSKGEEVTLEPVYDATRNPNLSSKSSISRQELPTRLFADWTRSKSSNSAVLNKLGSSVLQERTLNASLSSIGSYADKHDNSEVASSSATTDALRLDSTPVQVPEDTQQGLDHANEDSADLADRRCFSFDSESNGATSTITGVAAKDTEARWRDPSSGQLVLINSRTGVSRLDGSGHLPVTGLRQTRGDSANNRTRYTRIPSDITVRSSRENSWLHGILKDWKDPVFAQQTEPPVPAIQPDFGDGEDSGKLEHRSHQDGFDDALVISRLSKAALSQAEVIGQVDKKFILISIPPESKEAASSRTLTLVDQHAADERCRVEELLEDLCDLSKYYVPTVARTPLGFDISLEEAELFDRAKTTFASWNIWYTVKEKMTRGSKSPSRPASATSSSLNRVMSNKLLVIDRLPSVIAERCRLEPKVLIDLLRTELWVFAETNSLGRLTSLPTYSSVRSPRSTCCSRSDSSQSSSQYFPMDASQTSIDDNGCEASADPQSEWLRRLPSCPRSLVDLINSRACRSAVMFNDELSAEECRQLISRLAKCHFPFQCAHGRKSMVPLVVTAGSGMEYNTGHSNSNGNENSIGSQENLVAGNNIPSHETSGYIFGGSQNNHISVKTWEEWMNNLNE